MYKVLDVLIYLIYFIAANEALSGWGSQNSMDFGQLWVGLLSYYSQFDYRDHVVSISRMDVLRRTEKCWNRRLSIEGKCYSVVSHVMQYNIRKSKLHLYQFCLQIPSYHSPMLRVVQQAIRSVIILLIESKMLTITLAFPEVVMDHCMLES